MWLLALLIAVPIVEIALFIEVGGALGLWPTLAIVIATAVAGTLLLRAQGRGAVRDLQNRLEGGGDPRGPIAHGALILVAGVLLLTPGFFTDAVGLALLIPPVRGALIAWGAARLAGKVQMRGAVFTARAGHGRPPGAGDVVEGDFTREDADDAETAGDLPPPERRPKGDAPRDGGSGWTQR